MKKFINPFTGNKAKIFEHCYYAIKIAEDDLINDCIKPITAEDIEETCDIPQSIHKIVIVPSSIMGTVYINNTLCTDFDKA